MELDSLMSLTGEKYMETRVYRISGSTKNLNEIEKLLGHIEYLGHIGASRNILVRIDGDGEGRIKTKNEDYSNINAYNKKYNREETVTTISIVGTYDIK